MECSDVMLALILFIDDEIHDEIQVETFQTHFQQCPQCLSEMEHERQVLTRMKSLLADECCEQAPEDLNSRIAQQTALLAKDTQTGYRYDDQNGSNARLIHPDTLLLIQ